MEQRWNPAVLDDERVVQLIGGAVLDLLIIGYVGVRGGGRSLIAAGGGLSRKAGGQCVDIEDGGRLTNTCLRGPFFMHSNKVMMI
jgi:hypothetical protein